MEKDLDYLENLPNDVIRSIALELKPVDLISLCATNQKLKSTICEDRGFWYRKLIKDYPEYEKFQKLLDPKKTYIRKFTEITRIIEKYSGSTNPELVERYYKAYTEYISLHFTDEYKIFRNIISEREIVNKYNLNKQVFENIIYGINRVKNIQII